MTRKKKNKAVAGEPWVWLSGTGLSLGILMVVAILGLILVRGLDVFWPKSVEQWKLADSQILVGEKVLERDKKDSERDEKVKEIQIFQGNREALGQAFRFIDVDQISGVTEPKDILMLDRREYGRAMGIPQALEDSQGKKISSSDPNFMATLSQWVEAGNHRWDEIHHLEKKKIGKINHQMESLKFKIKDEKNPEKLAQLEGKQSELQNQYELLANEAQNLRSQQGKKILIYQIADGAKQKLATSQIIHFYYPNQLGLGERLGLFFRNVGVFLSEEPREANTEGGVFPAIFGTLVMTVLMSLAVVPLGVLSAIYLNEYAKQGWWTRGVRIAVNNLAGVPSIVFGVFGLGFFVYMVGGNIDSLFFSHKLPTPTFGTGGLFWASLTLALMTVPVVIVATEEALSAVSRGVREGALACGASKWQMIRRVILPAAAPGVLTGAILAMARGAGEVAPLMLVGVVKLAPTLPINSTFPFVHLDQKFMHLGFHIFDLGFQSPDSEAAKPMVFATTLLLIALVLVLNLGAILLRERLRKRYASASF